MKKPGIKIKDGILGKEAKILTKSSLKTAILILAIPMILVMNDGSPPTFFFAVVRYFFCCKLGEHALLTVGFDWSVVVLVYAAWISG